jgi:hypothetical protein
MMSVLNMKKPEYVPPMAFHTLCKLSKFERVERK